jgi:hypothetical protein
MQRRVMLLFFLLRGLLQGLMAWWGVRLSIEFLLLCPSLSELLVFGNPGCFQ